MSELSGDRGRPARNLSNAGGTPAVRGERLFAHQDSPLSHGSD